MIIFDRESPHQGVRHKESGKNQVKTCYRVSKFQSKLDNKGKNVQKHE